MQFVDVIGSSLGWVLSLPHCDAVVQKLSLSWQLVVPLLLLVPVPWGSRLSWGNSANLQGFGHHGQVTARPPSLVQELLSPLCGLNLLHQLSLRCCSLWGRGLADIGFSSWRYKTPFSSTAWLVRCEVFLGGKWEHLILCVLHISLHRGAEMPSGAPGSAQQSQWYTNLCRAG